MHRTLTVVLVLVIASSSLALCNAADAPTLQRSITYPRSVDYEIGGYAVSVWGDEGRCVVQTSDGGYAIIANLDDHYTPPHSGGLDNRTVEIIKTDSTGQLQWTKPVPNIEAAYSIVQTTDGGYAICGTPSWVFGSLIKLDSEGNLQWSRDIGARGVAIQTHDGGYTVAGSLPQETGTLANVVKTDGNGGVQWNKTYPSTQVNGWSYAYSIVERDGGFAVAGVKEGAWFALLDAQGNVENEKTYQSAGYFQRIIKSDDGFVVAGSAPENNNGSPLGLALLQKVDAQGNVVWSKTFNDPDYHDSQHFQFRTVTQTADGGYVASADTAIFKVDGDGNLLWYFTIQSDVTNQLGSMNAVTDSGDGGFVVTGSKSSSVWFAKFPVDQQPSPSDTLSGNAEADLLLPVAAVVIAGLAVAILVLLLYVRKLQTQLKSAKPNLRYMQWGVFCFGWVLEKHYSREHRCIQTQRMNASVGCGG